MHFVDGRPAFGPRNSPVSGGGSGPRSIHDPWSIKVLAAARWSFAGGQSGNEFRSHFRVHGETALPLWNAS
jgi:hypothetical protein